MIGSGRALSLGLALLFATLCLVIGFEITGQDHEQEQVVPARIAVPTREGPVSISEAPNQRDGWFRQIVSRPLFSPDRRPVGPEAHEVRGLPRLTGIITSGSRRVAIFANPSGGHPTVVEVGSHVGAYDVRDIADSGVTVIGPEGATVIRPIFDTAAPVPARSPLAARPELPKPAGR
jgi:hypothetical protein